VTVVDADTANDPVFHTVKKGETPWAIPERQCARARGRGWPGIFCRAMLLSTDSAPA
jgi:hypothetical protein